MWVVERKTYLCIFTSNNLKSKNPAKWSLHLCISSLSWDLPSRQQHSMHNYSFFSRSTLSLTLSC